MKNALLNKLLLKTKYLFLVLSLLLTLASLFLIYDLISSILRHQAQLERLNDAGINQMIKKCSRNPGWRFCYGEIFENLTQTHSVTYAVNTLKILETKDTQTQDCHIMAHKIAIAEMAKDPKRWKETIRQTDQNACDYGFIHGAIEGLSRFNSNFNLNEKTIPEFCRTIAKEKHVIGIDQTCAHAMGHVLLVDKYGSISKALDVCSKLSKNYKFPCYSGIFMESYTRNNLVIHGLAKYVPWDDVEIFNQEDLCRQYTGLISRACWYEIAFLYDYKYDDNPQKLWENCNHAPDAISRNGCYDHGLMTIKSLLEKSNANKNYFPSLCSPFITDKDGYNLCMFYVIHTLLNSSILTTPTAIEFCNVVDDDHKNVCFSLIGKLLTARSSQKQQEVFCSKVKQKYRATCVIRNNNLDYFIALQSRELSY